MRAVRKRVPEAIFVLAHCDDTDAISAAGGLER
jgi:hypothetical protein